LKRRKGPPLAVVRWLDSYNFINRMDTKESNHLPLSPFGYSSFSKEESQDSNGFFKSKKRLNHLTGFSLLIENTIFSIYGIRILYVFAAANLDRFAASLFAFLKRRYRYEP